MPDVMSIEVADRIATLTFDRPHKLNALDYATIDRLMAVLDDLEVAPDIRAVILTGAGRAFSAGADIPEFSGTVRQGGARAIRDFVRRGQAMTARIEAFPKPIIAAVNGLAFGGGCEIVEAAHLAIASETALFAKPEIRLGMPPTFGGTQRLPRLAGRKRALEHLLTGEPFPASTALAMGLVNAVVAPDQVMPAARDLAQRITRHASAAVQAILVAVTRGLNLSIGEGLEVESAQFASLVPTRDLAESLAVWAERKAPRRYEQSPGHVVPAGARL